MGEEHSAEFWTAVAEHSGDTAFRATEVLETSGHSARESGVVLRFPPQSMTRMDFAVDFIAASVCQTLHYLARRKIYRKQNYEPDARS